MTEIQRLALTSAFMTAAVVAGLSLSYVPHVELVTLVVFGSGILLGSSRGAMVGALGMPLYVFANSAIKGFPPSPLPVLVAQSLGMALPGVVGGLWRRFWLWEGIPRRPALFLLPLLGFFLAGINQVLLNFAYVLIMSDRSGPRMALFLSGMGFGVMDMIWNAVMFSLAGPPLASSLRRLARRNGWWRPSPGPLTGISVVGLALVLSGPVLAQTADGDSLTAEPEKPKVTFHDITPDSLRSEEPAPPDSLVLVKAVMEEGVSPTPGFNFSSGPLWEGFVGDGASIMGVPVLLAAGVVRGGEVSRVTMPGLAPSLDRWGLGWGRTRFTYDGIPFRGGVHGFDDPPDLPLAWRGEWKELFNATGTTIDVSLPAAPGEQPQSQISLTTGSLGRRTAEFALFRNLGPVEIGVDFGDREEQGWIVVSDTEASRLWFHVAPSGKQRRWSLDVSTVAETRNFADAKLSRDVRRLQGSVTRPFLDGALRLAGQFRRQSLQFQGPFDAFGEILFDGFTLQGDWTGPRVFPLRTRLRWDRDRRRGLLKEQVFDGVYGGGNLSGKMGIWGVEADVEIGWQEPFGPTWQGILGGTVSGSSFTGRVSVAHEEDLPSKVLGVDRPSPEAGIGDHLSDYETADKPEARSGVRVEGEWTGGPVTLLTGGWASRVRNYRLDSNPVWTFNSVFAPIDYPDRTGEILGAYGEIEIRLGKGIAGTGRGRVHSRDLSEVPYLSSWLVEGELHWRRWWFHQSIDLDIALGGTVIGPRQNPEQERYPATAIGNLVFRGRVDNGILTVAIRNIADSFLESDLRSTDLVTPFPIAGRTLVIGLTMYLSE